MNAPKCTYEIIYNGKNITGDITPFVLSINYIDKSKGESDEVDLLLEDTEGLWKLDWYPTKGDKLNVKIVELGQILDCGTFTIDEISAEGSTSGETISIKGIATSIKAKLRTKTSYAHEGKMLKEIVNTIAHKHGLTLSGKIADIRIDRITQYRQTDLQFLERLAIEYGYNFSIKDNKLIFTNVVDLETKSSALTIQKNEVTSYSFTDKTSKTYKSIRTSYHNPSIKQVIQHEYKESNPAFNGKDDILEIRIKTDNKQQAELKAFAALYKANSLQQQGSIEMPGNRYALAGNNCELVYFGMFSGLFYIQTSTHTITKEGGYSTSLEIKRVGLVTRNKQKE